MKINADYHTHTPYSHGKNTVLENSMRAKELDLKEIGITDHGFSHFSFALKRKKVKNLVSDCRTAERETGIKVYVGIESNILGISGKTDLEEKDYDDFELFIAGKHVLVKYEDLKAWKDYFFGNFFCDKFRAKPSSALVKYDTQAYINAIKNNPIDIISHLNYMCYSDALEVAKCAEDYGTYIELNSKKTHLTDTELSDIVAKTKVRFLIDSDAHSVSRIGDTALVDELIKRVHVPEDRIDNIDNNSPHFRFTEYKKKHG